MSAKTLFTPPIPEQGFLRLKQVLQIIPVGKSTWWAGVKSGRFPQPTKLGPKTTVWSASSIREFIAQAEGGRGE